MKIQEREEQKAKEFFQQLKQDDQRATPGFARLLAAAEASNERKASGWPGLRLAMAPVALILVLLAGGWFLFARQQRILYPPALPEDASRPAMLPDQCCEPVSVSTGSKPPKTLRRKRSAPPMQISALVSQWRSPTDFLLKTSEARWMKEVPRLGMPRVEIKPFVIKQNDEMEEL